MVMGDDSYLKGRGSESLCRILDEHLDIDCCKIVFFFEKKPKINNKEAGVGPVLKIPLRIRFREFPRLVTSQSLTGECESSADNVPAKR